VVQTREVEVEPATSIAAHAALLSGTGNRLNTFGLNPTDDAQQIEIKLWNSEFSVTGERGICVTSTGHENP
jgi:hypothetical protein